MKRIFLSVTLAALVSGCGVFGGDSKKPRTPVLGERLPVLVYETGVEPDPALADVTVVLPVAETNAAWSQPGGNAAKNLGHVTLAPSLSRVWSASIGRGGGKRAQLVSPPVAADGRVFAIDTTATVRAFDAASGRELWRQRLPTSGETEAAAFGGGVSVIGDQVFATSGLGTVSALNAATGRQIWTRALGLPLRGAPAVSDGRVLAMSQDNQLFALSATDGQSLWDMAGTVETAGLLGAGSPAIALDTVVAGFSSGELVALRIENGRPAWQDALSRTGISTSVSSLSDVDASPAIDRGRVFAIGRGGRMVAIELSTGQRVWEVNAAGTSTPWVAGDWVYVVTDDSRLLCLSRASGKVRWATQLPAYRAAKKKKDQIHWAGPVLASDGLFLTGSNGQMVSVSATSGEIISTTKLPDRTSLPPIVANNMLFVLSADGTLSAWR